MHDAQDSFFSRLLCGLGDALCVLDRSGLIVAANGAFASLAGQSQAALPGTALGALLPEADAALLRSRLGQCNPAPAVMPSVLGKAPGAPVRLTWLGAPAPASPLLLIAAVGLDDGAATQPPHAPAPASIEETLRQTLREMEAIMRNAPVGIIFTRERRIVRYNRRLAEMLGFPEDSGVGLPARVLFRSDEEYSALGAVAAPLLSRGLPFQQELFVRRQDGADLWINLIGYVQNQDDPREGTIWIAEDRGAFKRGEEELKRANADLVLAKERAEVANRTKSAFLASMSHELRTPLNSILGFSQILGLDKSLNERQSRGLAAIEQGGQHLLALINDVLDLARIEAGKLELHPDMVHLGVFLRAVTDAMRIRADQKKLRFDFEASPGLPRAVWVDERRLRQVLLNLLGNAVKFTDRGRVKLAVLVEPAHDFHARLRFEIRDTGVGIDAQHAARLFRPFEQVGEAQRRASGTGLGLAISRELMRAMGSDIAFTSTPGEGSVFTFELVVPVVGNQAVAPCERVVKGYRGPRKKVLIVDDIAQNRALLVEFLAALGFDLDEAADGSVALERAQASRPDLILMDNVMPVMSGLEATRCLRAEPALQQVPIIAISAGATHADRERSLAAGVDAFLHKPIDFKELVGQMAALLELSWVYEDETADRIASEA